MGSRKGQTCHWHLRPTLRSKTRTKYSPKNTVSTMKMFYQPFHVVNCIDVWRKGGPKVWMFWWTVIGRILVIVYPLRGTQLVTTEIWRLTSWILLSVSRSTSILVCFTSLMASLIRSVGVLSKCFYQGLWFADLNADVIGQSINRRGVA